MSAKPTCACCGSARVTAGAASIVRVGSREIVRTVVFCQACGHADVRDTPRLLWSGRA